MQDILTEIKTEFDFHRRRVINWPAHIHSEAEIVYVKQGSSHAFCQGKEYILEENCFFLVAPNQIHKFTEHVEGVYYVLAFETSKNKYFKELFEKSEPVNPLYIPNGDDDGMISLFEAAYEEYKRDGHSIIIDGYLIAFMGKLLRHYDLKDISVENNTVTRIISYCNAHYKENISVESVATDLHISRSSVSHVFSSAMSINFCEYINSLRLTDAVELLRNTRVSMSQVATASGFATIRTFNRAFQKLYGISPSKYRNANKKNAEA